MKRRNRRLSIRTPPKINQLSKKARMIRAFDGPTVHALAKKAELLSTSIESAGGIPRLAKHGEAAGHDALAFYAHQGIISHAQRAAGDIYGRLRRKLYGEAVARPKVYGRMGVEQVDQHSTVVATDDEREEQLIKDMASFAEANSCLRRESSFANRRLLRHIVIDGGWPDTWMDVMRLRQALNVLVRLWKL